VGEVNRCGFDVSTLKNTLLRTESMVGLTNSVQNERYVSGIFDNKEKFDEQ
jgi:hypothetical protein